MLSVGIWLSSSVAIAETIRVPDLAGCSAFGAHKGASAGSYDLKRKNMNDEVLRAAPPFPKTLESLDIVSVGISLDIFRQGNVWSELGRQNLAEPNALLVGSILPSGDWAIPRGPLIRTSLLKRVKQMRWNWV